MYNNNRTPFAISSVDEYLFRNSLRYKMGGGRGVLGGGAALNDGQFSVLVGTQEGLCSYGVEHNSLPQE